MQSNSRGVNLRRQKQFHMVRIGGIGEYGKVSDGDHSDLEEDVEVILLESKPKLLQEPPLLRIMW